MAKSKEELQKELEKLKKEQQQMEHRIQPLKNRKNYVTPKKERMQSQINYQRSSNRKYLTKSKRTFRIRILFFDGKLFHEKQLYAQTETLIDAIISKRGGK